MSTGKPRQDDKPEWASAEEMADAREWMECMVGALRSARMKPVLNCLRQDLDQLHLNTSVMGTPLCLAGTVYARGFGAHGESDLEISLPPGSRRLTGLCGVNDSDRTRGQTRDQTFSILLDGRKMWSSGPLRAESPPGRFDVPLRGGKRAVLRVRGPIRRAHVNWVDLQVDGAPVVYELPGPDNFLDFRCGGKRADDLLRSWPVKSSRVRKAGAILHRFRWTDARTGLEAVCEVTEYEDFPVVEWVARLRNRSTQKSPIIENLRALNLTFRRGSVPYLHHWNGDSGSPEGYEAFRSPLAHGEEYAFASEGGKPTNRAWPCFNLEWPDTRQGAIVVVGWPGQWACRIAGEEMKPGGVRITAGQQKTRFRLLPGEEARTPTSLVMLYCGDRERSQNLWRRWYRAHLMPGPGGKRMQPHLVAHGTDDGRSSRRPRRRIRNGVAGENLFTHGRAPERGARSSC